MSTTNLCLVEKEPILEYKDSYSTLLCGNSNLYIRPDKSYWLFPGFPRKINVGLELMIPNQSIGLIIKNEYLGPNLQLDTQVINDSYVIHVSKQIPFLYIINRGWLPKKLSNETIIAELIILPKQECHIVNNKGWS